VSAPIPPSGDPNHFDVDDDDRARASAALQAAFDRLQPQGSDAWNFLGAFTHMGDRYGPYQPGASALSKLVGEAERGQGKSGGRMGRFRRGPDEGERSSEVDEAMLWVVEAFRFLSGRVRDLEARLDREDRPVDGAAWLVPAQDLDALVEPVAAHVAAHSPGGIVVHGDCGSGTLLRALTGRGLAAQGVEPRGGVALGAIERGSEVSINEVLDDLAARPDDSVGALVLSGVVDRLPLHALLALLTQCRRTLAHSAPLVVVSTDPSAVSESWDAAAVDLTGGRPLHVATWGVLLERAGFVDIAPLPGTEADGRAVLAASAPG
jgi:hypothetical protein